MSARLHAWLPQQWEKLTPWHLALLPLSWVFWLLSSLRRWAYQVGLFKSYALPVPVIIVGNLTVGGTGKTPLVIWLVDRLRQAGLRPGVITRGYGARMDETRPVDGASDPNEVGDEPVLLAIRAQCPVWAGRDRVAAATGLLHSHPECNVLISDDGLQHYRLRRNVEIVVIDGVRRFGNRQLLPAGPLRERPSRLQQADAVICNGGSAQPGEYGMQLVPGNFINLLDPAMVAAATDFQGKRLLAIAGIGNPARFFRQLQASGLQCRTLAFPDHHHYHAADLQNEQADAILMTEKDAVKCRAFAKPNWWYLPVQAVLEPDLGARILQKLRK